MTAGHEGSPCDRCGDFLTDETVIRFYDGRPYCRSCMDRLAEPGFADFVRAHPTIVSTYPHRFLDTAANVAGLCVVATLILFALSQQEPRAAAIFGVVLAVHALLFIRSRKSPRRIVIADGRFREEGWHTLTPYECPLDHVMWLPFDLRLTRAVGAIRTVTMSFKASHEIVVRTDMPHWKEISHALNAIQAMKAMRAERDRKPAEPRDGE